MTGAALFQPPKSSSALVFGALVVPNPPLPARAMFADMALAQPVSDLTADFEGENAIVVALGAEEAGSGVAHASLEAHGSAVEKVENPDVSLWATLEDIDAGGGGIGAERLNAEFMLDGGGLMLLVGGAAVVSEKSNRSFKPEVAVDFVPRDLVSDAELKAPKPLEELRVRCACGAGGLD